MMNESPNARVVNPSKRIFMLQAVLMALIASVFGLLQGQWAATSVLYGSSCAMLMAFLLAQSIRFATNMPVTQASSAMAVLYVGAVIRFVLVIVLLGAGLWLLALAPLPMLLGFAIVQLVYPLLGKRR